MLRAIRSAVLAPSTVGDALPSTPATRRVEEAGHRSVAAKDQEAALAFWRRHTELGSSAFRTFPA